MAKVGKVKVIEGRAGFCLAGDGLPGETTRGAEDEEGGKSGCFQFRGKETRPFYQPSNKA